MAADKYLKNVSGVPTEQAATQSSAGAGNAGDILALDDDGLLDPSVFPSGYGAETFTLAASENLSAGNLVNVWDDSGTLKVRKADASSEKPADGFVSENVTSGNNALVFQLPGTITGLTGLTAGAKYYLSGTTPGGVATTPPSGAGKIAQFLGFAKSTTELVVLNRGYIVLAA